MKRIIACLLALSLTLCMFLASVPALAEDSVEMRTVVDLGGAELEVPAHPERIVILPDAICSLAWQLMGGADRMITLTNSSKNQWTNFLGAKIYPEMESVPAGLEENVEELLSHDPDLIISMSGGTAYQDQNDAFAALGQPVYMIPSDALYNDPIAVIEAMGDLLNCEDRAAQLVNYMNETDAFVAERVETIEETGKRLYNTVWVDDMKAWTAGSINAGIISALKCENISDDPASSTAFTMEEIIGYDPEIVFISFDDYTPQNFYDNEVPGQDWTVTTAVKNHQVYRGPSLLQRWAQSFSTEKFLYKRWMAAVVYPEVFPMDECVEYIRSYLKDFYGYEISDDELAYCLNTEENGL